MSKEALAKVVQRAISDAGFRRQLSSDPAGALRGFNLSADEVSALRTGDAGRLSTLGIDQRMSKSFALAGAAAATRLSQADLAGGTPAMVDDASGMGAKTVIPSDPQRFGAVDASGAEAVRSADIDAGTGGNPTVRAGDDWKFEGRIAPEGSSNVRVGDDWKFADRGMANYPAHDGLAGPSGAQSVRAGDDWARSAQVADTGRIGNARLDDATGGASGGANVIHDDPNGFLAANADAGGEVTRANVIHDDPNGFLAANADASGASSGETTAFIDESESYLTKVGYDSSAAASPSADATWSGDDIAGPSSIPDDSPPAATDDGQLTP